MENIAREIAVKIAGLARKVPADELVKLVDHLTLIVETSLKQAELDGASTVIAKAPVKETGVELWFLEEHKRWAAGRDKAEQIIQKVR